MFISFTCINNSCNLIEMRGVHNIDIIKTAFNDNDSYLGCFKYIFCCKNTMHDGKKQYNTL